MSTQRTIPQLDGLRGIAILLVVTFHLGIAYTERFREGIDQIPSALFGFGWSGVDLFFVLSGFLITGILLDTRTASNYFGSFFARRFLRIFPLYYGLLLLWFLVLPAVVSPFLSGRELELLPNVIRPGLQSWYWTYTQNIANSFGQDVPGLSHLWSLAVEEQFYVGWAFVVWLTRTPRRTLGVAVGGAALAILARGLLAARGEAWLGPSYIEAIHRLTICRMDALLVGGALAAWMRFASPGAVLMARRGLLVISAAAFSAVGLSEGGWRWSTPIVQTVGYSVLAVAFGVVLLYTLDGTSYVARCLDNPVLRSFGKYSYAIYVIHWPLHSEGQRVLAKRGFTEMGRLEIVLYVLGGTLASYLLARVSWVVLESPFLRLKKHFEARSAEPQSVGTTRG